MKKIIPVWPSLPNNVIAFTTTRQGGFSADPFGDGVGGLGLNLGEHVGDALSNVRSNREKLNLELPKPVIFFSQMHGKMVVDAANLRDCQLVEADACIASQSHLVCAVLTADCLPILLASKDGKHVAAIHAGWRGLAEGIVDETISQMRIRGADEITAWMGPAIGPSAFEVGEDVILAFNGVVQDVDTCFTATSTPRKFLANIYELARHIMRKSHVGDIYGGAFCTVSEPELFYSFRRDRVTGRMASLIWMT